MSAPIPAWVGGDLVAVDKLEAHRRGLRHMAVSVFVTQGDAVLIQRRAQGKYHTPGLWANACCTHPHWGEPAATCARRRLDEELGLAGPEPEHRGQVEYRADVGGGMVEHELVEVFLARLARRPVLRPDPAEVMDTAWLSRADLLHRVRTAPERFTPWLRIYLDRHLDTILG